MWFIINKLTFYKSLQVTIHQPVEYCTPIPYNVKSNVFAINMALKQLFCKTKDSGVPIVTRDGKILALFHTTYYDHNNIKAIHKHIY